LEVLYGIKFKLSGKIKPLFRNFTLLFFLLCVVGTQSKLIAKIEEPSYKLIQKSNSIEIRDYQQMVIIKTDLNTKMNNGFRTLANYIFGGNSTNQKIAMTAPVITGEFEESKQAMVFVLPSEIALESAPKPLSNNVEVGSFHFQKVATIRFSGYATDTSIKKQLKKLTEWLKKEKIKHDETLFIAQYNAPWVLGPLRRNEIWLRLEN
tara:strand:+ start:419 stop:1039 length:621 start_codon:yes stop_codon:yes gene_type:complete